MERRRRIAGLSTLRAEAAASAPSRADQVRGRLAARAQKDRERRPLVRPARRAKPRPNARRRFEMTLPMRGEAVALPALPSLPFGWRWISFCVALLAGALFLHLYAAPEFQVDGLDLIGANLVPGEEILDAAGVHGLSAFLIDPQSVRSRVEAISGVESAQVSVDWPGRVTVVVAERVPVLLWQQGETRAWVDRHGQVFEARAEQAGLLPITVDDAGIPLDESEDGSTPAASVPADVVAGALQLRALRPNIELLHYDSLHGLSYQDGRGWRGYFGTGANMDVKLKVYETLVDQLLARQIRPAVVSVENVDAAYYRSR